MSDGIGTLDVHLDLGYDAESDTFSIDVPLAYYEPGATDVYQDLTLSLVLDPEFNILSEAYYAYEEGGTLGAFTADPQGLIYPLLQYQSADGAIEWVDHSEVGLYADLPNLAYEFVPLESGTPLHVELGVVDFGGNHSSVYAQDLVP
jgi:hypothetical protein